MILITILGLLLNISPMQSNAVEAQDSLDEMNYVELSMELAS